MNVWGELASHKRLFNPPPQFSRLGTRSPALVNLVVQFVCNGARMLRYVEVFLSVSIFFRQVHAIHYNFMYMYSGSSDNEHPPIVKSLS